MATTRANTDEQGGLPRSVVEDLLADERRHTALSTLAERGEPMVVESLAAAVAATERDCDPGDVPADARETVREELFTDHIPKLTATGVLEYDSMLGTVELRRPDILELEAA